MLRPGTPSTAEERAANGRVAAGAARRPSASAVPAAGAEPDAAVRTATHCPYCSLQCGMEIRQQSGEALEVAPNAFPTNRGTMCQKGWTSAELLRHPDRLTTPLMRDSRDAELRPASWDEALDRVARELRETARRHDPDAVGVFGGGGLTNEKAYQLGKIARVALRTSAIDYNGRFCMSSAATASQRAFGLDRGLPFPLEDIARTDAILLVGSNLVETMPPAMAYLDDQRLGGGTLVVIDPRATLTARRAHLHLQPMPGTDLALANALLHIAIKDGFVDAPFVERRTSGFSLVEQRVGAYWPDRVERITGVPVDDMRRAVRLLAQAPTAMVLTGRGPEQQSKGTDTVQAFINLALALGRAGKPLCGYGCLTGQGNGQGGREHGQKSDQLPGYRRIDDPHARRHVARVWGVEPDDLPGVGRSAWEMLDAMGRVVLRRAALRPPASVRSDLEILEGIAQRLGCGGRFRSRPRAVFDELRRASAGGKADYAGITYDRIAAEDGIFWPCPDERHPGTPRLFLDAFATPDGRARFHPVSHREAGEEPDDEFPLYLTTGRTLVHYQSGTQTRRVTRLREAEPQAFVELHPVLARRMRIEEHDVVGLRTRRGAGRAVARLRPDIRPDTLSWPFTGAARAA